MDFNCYAATSPSLNSACSQWQSLLAGPGGCRAWEGGPAFTRGAYSLAPGRFRFFLPAPRICCQVLDRIDSNFCMHCMGSLMNGATCMDFNYIMCECGKGYQYQPFLIEAPPMSIATNMIWCFYLNVAANYYLTIRYIDLKTL